MNHRIDVRILAVGFLVLAVVSRLLPLGHNFAAAGALGMFVGCFWSVRMGLLFSLTAMAVSEILGEWLGVPSMGAYATWLMVVVYAAVACSAGVGKGMSLVSQRFKVSMLAAVPAGAVAATAVFYVVTNFASWLDPQMGYPRSLGGLVQCYIAGIPFARNTLLGNLAFSGLFFGVYAWMASHRASASLRAK